MNENEQVTYEVLNYIDMLEHAIYQMYTETVQLGCHPKLEVQVACLQIEAIAEKALGLDRLRELVNEDKQL